MKDKKKCKSQIHDEVKFLPDWCSNQKLNQR